jgi:uncharacterized RDD family membrane protein YckC
MVKASTLQRFGAFLIDLAIIIFVYSIIIRFVNVNIKIPEMGEEVINAMSDNLKAFYLKEPSTFPLRIFSADQNIASDYQSWILSSEYLNFYASYRNAIFSLAGIIILIITGLVFIYMVVLPYFWDKQTLGRLLLKVKVVNEDDTKPSFLTYLVREVIGGVLINLLNVFFFVIAIINIVFISKKNYTIGDMISKTKLIRYDEEGQKIKERNADNDGDILKADTNENKIESNVEEYEIIIDPEDKWNDKNE